MANFFTLQDGLLTDLSAYGYSLLNAESMNYTNGVWLTSVDIYSQPYISDGNSIFAVAINISAVNLTSDSLRLKLSSYSNIQTEIYPLANFTSYNGSNNFITSYPQNWQILKLSTPFIVPKLSGVKISLTTSLSNSLALIGLSSGVYNRTFVCSAVSLPTSTDNIHIGGALITSSKDQRTITARTSTFNNIYIHSNGILQFPYDTNVNLTVNGPNGIQVTSDGLLQIGNLNNYIPLSTKHTIILNNNQIDVHNGGDFNVYGYPKLIGTNLANDYSSGNNIFTTTSIISNNWLSGDSLFFKPNLTQKRNFNVLVLSSFVDNYTFTTSTNNQYSVSGLSFNYIPNVFNLNRNILIKGFDINNRGTIRSIDAASTNLNYMMFNFLGTNAYNKNGFVLGTNSFGNFLLSGCSIINDSTTNLVLFTPMTGRLFQNNTFYNNLIYLPVNYGLLLSSVKCNNIVFDTNYILGPTLAGLQMIGVSGNTYFNNNICIGANSYGNYLFNNTLTSGSYGVLSYNSLLQGMMVSANNTGTIVGGGVNSDLEGVYFDGNSINSNKLSFYNIKANNNSSVGFRVSGNNLVYTNPVTLNINGLLANTNNSTGLEAFNIVGNLSNIITNQNTNYGINSIIGNGKTVFNGVTSLNHNYNFYIKGTNFNETIITNSLLSGSQYALYLNSTYFEQFFLENSTVSSYNYSDIYLDNSNNILQGSYNIHTSYLNEYEIKQQINKYQPEIYNESGFAFMNHNNIPQYHFRYYNTGKISLDNTIGYTGLNISEKIEPSSALIPIRSSSKIIPVELYDNINISVRILLSDPYTGTLPKLILKQNSSVGFAYTVLAISTGQYGNWELLTANIRNAQNAGIIEFYIECSGNDECGSVNIDNWDFRRI